MITKFGSDNLQTHLQHRQEAASESTFFTTVPQFLHLKLEFLVLDLEPEIIFLAINFSIIKNRSRVFG